MEGAGHPDRIELCGHCGQRIGRLGPDASQLYCYHCGHGDEAEPIVYWRLDGT